MTNLQRIKNDDATIDRRQVADKALRDHRDRNDELTSERRFKADRLMEDNRMRNDGITANRRYTQDRNPGTAFAVFLLILVILAAGTFFVFT